MTTVANSDLFRNISNLIEKAKNDVAHYANAAINILYWQIGYHINQHILKNDRAEYGNQVIKQLATQLTQQYGSGFDIPNLTRMVRLTKLFPEMTIVVALSQQLSWSHFLKLISIDDPLKRDFYTELCRLERWSVRGLRQKIDSMLYERSAIAKQPESVIKSELEKFKNGDLTNPDFYLQDPCILKFISSGNFYRTRT